MQYNKINQYFQIITFILFIIFITIFFGNVEILASENIYPEVPDFIPKGTIVLDEPSSQELVYVSSDQSVLVFRNTTSQLEQLQPGDALLLNVTQFNTSYLLFQIKHIIKGRPNNKGIMIEVIPWKNHPPFISALITQPYTLEINNPSNLICYAADEDEDMLHYIWAASGGIISGDGPNITWTAPDQTGNYEITCEVIDSSGDKNIKSV